MKRVNEGLITKVESNTEGWGTNERPVGIDIEVSYQFLDTKLDSDGELVVLTRKTVFTFPIDYRADVHVGDRVKMTFEIVTDDDEEV